VTILHSGKGPVTRRIRRITDLHAAQRALPAQAALLLQRQIVLDQEGRELLSLGRGVDGGADEMAGRQRDAPVSQQGRQAAPVEPVARLPVHPIATAQPSCAYSMT
jgi:hypothetical protein